MYACDCVYLWQSMCDFTYDDIVYVGYITLFCVPSFVAPIILIASSSSNITIFLCTHTRADNVQIHTVQQRDVVKPPTFTQLVRFLYIVSGRTNVALEYVSNFKCLNSKPVLHLVYAFARSHRIWIAFIYLLLASTNLPVS